MCLILNVSLREKCFHGIVADFAGVMKMRDVWNYEHVTWENITYCGYQITLRLRLEVRWILKAAYGSANTKHAPHVIDKNVLYNLTKNPTAHLLCCEKYAVLVTTNHLKMKRWCSTFACIPNNFWLFWYFPSFSPMYIRCSAISTVLFVWRMISYTTLGDEIIDK